MKVIRLPKYNSVFRVRVSIVIVGFSCVYWSTNKSAIDIWNKVKPVIVPTMRWMWTHQMIRNKIRNKREMKISLMWRSTPYKSYYSLLFFYLLIYGLLFTIAIVRFVSMYLYRLPTNAHQLRNLNLKEKKNQPKENKINSPIKCYRKIEWNSIEWRTVLRTRLFLLDF